MIPTSPPAPYRLRATGPAPPFALALALALAAGACSAPPEPAASPPELAGDWRAVLASPGGELPFTLRIREGDGGLHATAVNGAEEAPFSAVVVEGDRVRLDFDWYDSEIEATLDGGGGRLEGRWRKTVPEGESTLAFSAVKGDRGRFPPAVGEAGAAAGVPSVAGSWAVVFTDPEGSEKALGELTQGDGPRVTGTFLTPTGDYRFLEGEYRGGRLRLSCFDGAHAFLFDATARPDGSLAGDFWSRDSYHATWTARRLEGDGADGTDGALPDPFELVRLTNQEQRFDFSLPDLEGRPLSLSDPRFQGKVVLVNLFGSWCPNCNDEAPLLARWYRRYRDRGLEIVGLAFEITGNPQRDAMYVHKFARRHGLEYPLVLAGTSDKTAAAELLEDLDRVVAYPTTLFIGRDRRVRKIHSGFAGPGTGAHHEEMVRELEGLIEELLAEPAPLPTTAG